MLERIGPGVKLADSALRCTSSELYPSRAGTCGHNVITKCGVLPAAQVRNWCLHSATPIQFHQHLLITYYMTRTEDLTIILFYPEKATIGVTHVIGWRQKLSVLCNQTDVGLNHRSGTAQHGALEKATWPLESQLLGLSRCVQPTAHRPHEAQGGCECSPTQNHKFT